MALNVTESNAATILADWIDAGPRRYGAPPVTDAAAVEALDILLRAAGKRLLMSFEGRAAKAIARQGAMVAAGESDGAAQAVCRAIADHLAHGGSLPWPSISKPYAEWVTAHAAAEAR